MKSFSAFLFFGASAFLATLLPAQQTSAPQRDLQALALVQQSIAAQGGSAPSDSSASGTVTIVAGSSTDTGTIRILTRALDQSSEQIVTPNGTRKLVYSRGRAVENEIGSGPKLLPMELVVTSQSVAFPLPLLAHILITQDSAYQYVGTESIDNVLCHHLQTWNTFASKPDLHHLTEFSMRDFWIDSANYLPRKVAYTMRAGSGAVPRISMEVSYSDYRTIGSFSYPFSISKSMNGTPWVTITIQSVAFNTGLTDTDFAVR